ncbi:MAG: hypothetical protein LBP78_01465 [Acidaminococcales bacterium]|nr:hypothetical protein [Acidaminococcales bacterium]
MFESIANKEIRGYVLKVAKISYPRPIGSNVIDVFLVDAGMQQSLTQIEGHLRYLEEREYVKCKKSQLEVTGTPIALVTLTARGIDLLEKTISDPGVHVR